MVKSDLLSVNPLVEENTLFIVIKFLRIAKFSPKELGFLKLTIEEFLNFLESCIANIENNSEIIPNSKLNVFFKTQVHLIASQEDLYFTFTTSKWKEFIYEEIEKLLLRGIIKLEE